MISLRKDGIMLKAFAPLHGRRGFFRIAIGTHEENALCVQGIKRFLAGRRTGKEG